MKNQMFQVKALNVLSLEDSPRDFEIISKLLRDAGFDLKIFRVEKEIEYASLIRSNLYDIILFDYSLPGFDAFRAIQLAKDICPQVPLICISGLIGEELAVELLKAGATDYLLKDRMKRLPSAIRRALDEAQSKKAQKQAEEEIQRSAMCWQNTFDGINDIVFLLDNDNIITQANRKAKVFYNNEGILGRHCCEAIHGSSEPIKDCPFLKMKLSKQREIAQYQIGTKWFDVIVDPIHDDDDNIMGAVHIINEITERKLAELTIKQKVQELEAFNALMINREIRMIELKKEINGLLKKAGEMEKYKIVRLNNT